MEAIASSFTRAVSTVSSCFRSTCFSADPEMSPDAPGAILYPDQLKSGRDGGPRYVISVGEPPCERSTVDFAPHHDSLFPRYRDTAPKCVVSLALSAEGCAGLQDEWFPCFTCSSHRMGTPTTERIMVHNRGYGQPWHLLGRQLPPARIMTCKIVSVNSEDAGLLRFWRDGQHITILPISESDDDEFPEPWTSNDRFTLVLFDYARGTYDALEDRNVSFINRRLCDDLRWCVLRDVIRKEFDVTFGKYDEYVTTIFGVDRDSGAIQRTGMGVVYRGCQNDDVTCSIVEIVSHNYAVSPLHANEYGSSCERATRDSGRRAFMDAAYEASVPQHHRNSGPPYVPEDRSGAGTESDSERDFYGWEAACEGPGLGLPSASHYTVTVKPNVSLRLGVDIVPVYCTTQETTERFRACANPPGAARRKHGPGVPDSFCKRRRKIRYDPADGCGCDTDERFTTSVSRWLREECKWMRSQLSSLPAFEESSAAFEFSVRSPAESLQWCGKPPSNEPTEDTVSWFVPTAGGWLARKPVSEIGGNPDNDVPFLLTIKPHKPRHRRRPCTSRYERGDVDWTAESRVARSNMGPWDSRRCRVMLTGRAFNSNRRGLRRGLRNTAAFFEFVDRNARRRLSRGEPEHESPAKADELCFMVFVGTTMRVTTRVYFSLDDDNRAVLMEEMSGMTKAICVADGDGRSACRYPVGTRPSVPFVFMIAAVKCDIATGARNCFRRDISFGGVTTRPEAVFYAAQRIRELCNDASVAGMYNLRTLECVPQLRHVPFRFVMEFAPEASDCSNPRVVSCKHYCALPLHCEEAKVLGSNNAWRIPDQRSFCRCMTKCDGDPPVGDCSLGLFFPFCGIRMLTTECKRRLGEYCQRFYLWFHSGPGAAHYGALRRLVPLCDCFLSDVALTSNFFGYGMLLHLHCLPNPEREKMIVAVMSRAILDAQKYADSSLHVDIKTY